MTLVEGQLLESLAVWPLGHNQRLSNVSPTLHEGPRSHVGPYLLPLSPHTLCWRAGLFVLFPNSRKACTNHYKLQKLWLAHCASLFSPRVDPLPNGCHKTRHVPSPPRTELSVSVRPCVHASVCVELIEPPHYPSGNELRHKGACRQDSLLPPQCLSLTALFSSRSHFLKKCLVSMC